MKIIEIKHDFTPCAGHPCPDDAAEREMPEVVMMTDSSLLKDRKPFFVPDFAEQFVAKPYVVARVHRLGKNIARRFASRYYDALAVGVAVEARGLCGKFAGGCAGAVANAFDGAAILGDFEPIEAIGDTLEVALDGNTLLQCPTADVAALTDAMIEYVSRYFTLKIGDIIYVCSIGAETVLMPETVVRGSINGVELLHFKVK